MFTVLEAANAVGKSKSTILRDIRENRLGATRDGKKSPYKIDPAELYRVYPDAPRRAIDAPDGASRRTDNAAEIAALKAKLDAAETRAEERERQIHQQDRTIDDLRSRLDTEGEERRKLTAMLTDQRTASDKSKGFWSRLRGN